MIYSNQAKDLPRSGPQFYWIDGTLPPEDGINAELIRRLKSKGQLFEWVYGERISQGQRDAARAFLGREVPPTEHSELLLQQSCGYKFTVLLHDDLSALGDQSKAAGKPSYDFVDVYFLKHAPPFLHPDTEVIVPRIAERYKTPGKASYIAYFTFKSEEDSRAFDGERHLTDALNSLGFAIDPPGGKDNAAYKDAVQHLLADTTAVLDPDPQMAVHKYLGALLHYLDSVDY